jgi:hypothetical protein
MPYSSCRLTNVAQTVGTYFDAGPRGIVLPAPKSKSSLSTLPANVDAKTVPEETLRKVRREGLKSVVIGNSPFREIIAGGCSTHVHCNSRFVSALNASFPLVTSSRGVREVGFVNVNAPAYVTLATPKVKGFLGFFLGVFFKEVFGGRGFSGLLSRVV